MLAVDATLLPRLQRLESDLKVVFHHLSWTEMLPCACPDELVSRCVTAGIPKEKALHTIALHMGIRTICDPEGIDLSNGFFVNGGYYSRTEKRMYLRNRISEALAEPENFGLLLGETVALGKGAKLNNEQMLTLHTMANLVKDLRSAARTSDVVFRGGVAIGAYAQRTVPMAVIDTSQLGVSYARIIDKSFVSSLWASAIEHAEHHITSRLPGRIIFLCGDYMTDDVSSLLASRVSARTIFTTSTVASNSDVVVLSIDALSQKTAQQALETAKRRDGYVVFTTSAGNMTQLIERALRLFSVGDLSANWGAHYFRRVLPSLCSHCRVEETYHVHLGDETLSITDDLRAHFSRGTGCEHCADGYSGHAVVTEDMGERAAFIFMMLKVFRDGLQDDADGEVLLSSEKSVYAFSGSYYRSTKGTRATLLNSLKGLVRSGAVQVADTHGLLV
jgi:hypothetical protein